jgi:hypothetical protein
MDVTRVISELRAERAAIERAILSLERADPVNSRRATAAAHSVIEIGRAREHHGGSFMRRACRRQMRKLSS